MDFYRTTRDSTTSGEEDQLTELCIRSKAYWGYEAEFLEKTRDDLTVKHSFVPKGMVLVGRESLGGDPIAVSALNDLGHGEFEIELFFIAPVSRVLGLVERYRRGIVPAPRKSVTPSDTS